MFVLQLQNNDHNASAFKPGRNFFEQRTWVQIFKQQSCENQIIPLAISLVIIEIGLDYFQVWNFMLITVTKN